ncbi:hypothetical protein GB937_005347 [Aspergillus fischeri]|nr:hypothetical protein GB937_005347 [Aspergillus fischeri]
MPAGTNVTDESRQSQLYPMLLNPTRTRDPGYIYTAPPLLPTAPGTILGCYLYKNPGKYTELCQFGCDDFASAYEITISELLAWNSWLMGNCGTALYANLEESATRAVCIGTSTASLEPTTLPETTAHTTAYRAKYD